MYNPLSKTPYPAGVTLTGGEYKLYKSGKMTEKAGSITWINKGEVEAIHGYLWDEDTGTSLSGYSDNTVYKDRDTALKACSTSNTCSGVTKEGQGVYRCNTGTTHKLDATRTSWIQKTSVVTHQKTLFSVLPGYTLDKLDKTVQASEAAAAAACIKKDDCTGFVKKGGKYHIALGWAVFSDEESISYIRNDLKLAYVSYSLYLNQYYWQVKAPYIHKNLDSTAYDTLPKALVACVGDPRCHGISFVVKKGHYYLASFFFLFIGNC